MTCDILQLKAEIGHSVMKLISTEPVEQLVKTTN